MSTTHSALGVLLAVPVARVAPEFAGVAALAAYAGGVFPDLDVVYRHRRALHYPDYYWLAAVSAAALSAWRPGPATVAAAAFLGSAALHSASDVLGGGPGLRPWADGDDRGVYCHARGRWLKAREWIRYDGAPEDLALCVVASAPGLLVFDGAVRVLLLAGLVASASYALVRRRIPGWLE